jgi:uncharacterized membrane protein (DUF373 family)
MASSEWLSKVRACRRPGSDGIDLRHHRLGHLETGDQDLVQSGSIGHIRSDRSGGVPERVRNDLHVIIALEFKRTLVLVTERTESVVQVRAVILIALLAIIRKLIILDISPGDAPQLLALAVATLSLGGVYWLVRDQDSRERE